ncbi:DUF370 domain-containing protein [candidate division FCPU426 bacterium]|nr:DUF370 domain-containing protein [candidate division FCPU426 bacterium]
MSLHLGNDFFISSRQIMAIVNLQHLHEASLLHKTMAHKRAHEHIRCIGKGPYRSLVLTVKNTYYLSPLDSKTLLKRHGKERLYSFMEEKYGKKGL